MMWTILGIFGYLVAVLWVVVFTAGAARLRDATGDD
jgi:hypothetical protein